MNEYERLSHTTWDCKYHVVFIPKCRRKTLYQELRRHLGEVFRRLAIQKESKVEEGHLMPDHVHMLLSIPPKVVGACATLRHRKGHNDALRLWASGMLERKTVKYKFNLTAVALANKVARIVFVLMTRGGHYDDRPVAA